MMQWAPQIAALLCGGLVFMKLLDGCDTMAAQWNKIPLVPDVKDAKCAQIKYIKWALAVVGLCCACCTLRMITRVRDFFTPSY